jgi:spore photoproduct lyase
MFDFIYIEEAVRDHPRVRRICARFSRATCIPCERYGEVFNRRAQNFRLQKQRPALILAAKRGRLVLKAPPGYGIGGDRNYYFSHMLNCVYDCRYCFLQGMYRSAHMVVFVNYEDFQHHIAQQIQEDAGQTPYFFSGYDCDSLALESITRFAGSFLEFFAAHPRAFFELRTKSVRLHPLLGTRPLPNCIVAFSLTPPPVADGFEVGAPPVHRRLEAMAQIQERGWPLGVRFDPLILHANYQEHYRQLFAVVFERLNIEALHSVSLGLFRLPRGHYKTLYQLYPDEKLLAHGLEEKHGVFSYREELALELHDFCTRELRRYIPEEVFFPCASTILPAPA